MTTGHVLPSNAPNLLGRGPSANYRTARQCSLAVFAFPWGNRSTLTSDNLAETLPSDHFSQKYVGNIASFDRQIRSPGFEWSKLRHVLHVVPPSDLVVVDVGPTKYRQLYRLFFHYRLIKYLQRDQIPPELAMNMMEGISPSLPIHCRVSQLYSSCQPFCGKFKDWIAVLKRFQLAMNNWRLGINAPKSALLSGRSNSVMRTQVNMLLSLAGTAKREDAEAISTNFVAAALYLHHLLNEPDLRGDRLPDLLDGTLGREVLKQWCRTGFALDSHSAVHANESTLNQQEKDPDCSHQDVPAAGQSECAANLHNVVPLESNQIRDNVAQPLRVQHFETSAVSSSSTDDPEVELSDQDYEDVCRTIGNIGDVGSLRIALQSAAYISPMLLLADAKIYRWSWSQVDILKYAKELGNDTPAIVRQIDTLIFRALVDVATGQKEASTALCELCDEIPWNELETQTTEVRSWFSAKYRKAPQDLSLLSVDLSGPLGDEWRFRDDLKEAAGSSFKIMGLVPTSKKHASSAVSQSAVSQPGVSSDSGAAIVPSPNIASELGSAVDRGPTAMSTAADAAEEVIEKDAQATPTNDIRGVSPKNAVFDELVPSAGQNLANANVNAQAHLIMVMDDSPADTAKKRALHKLAKAHAQPLTEPPSLKFKLPPRRKPRSASTRSKKSGPGSHAPPSRKYKSTSIKHEGPISKPQAISAETTTLVKQSLREHYWQPVKVKEEYKSSVCEVKLEIDSDSAAFFGEDSKFSIFNPIGEEIVVTPALHFPENVATLIDFVSAAKELDHLGKPLHASESPSSSKQSCFNVMASSHFSSLKPKEFREAIRSQTIVTVDANAMPGNFDMDALLQFQSFSTTFNIEGNFSYGIEAVERSGTIGDILKCAQQDDASKVLQVKCMPLSSVAWNLDSPFSTDCAAWRATTGKPFAKDHHLPTADYHFALVATKGAHHWWDLPLRGAGRYMTVKTGGQCIWLARPKARTDDGVLCPRDYDVMGDIDLFNSDVYNDPKPRHPQWLVEQIYLGPGMTIYIKPGTPFASYHPENTIGIGGYFYTTGLMAETFYALVHDFVFAPRTIKSDPSPTLVMIHRLIQFYHAAFAADSIHEQDRSREHLPDLATTDSVIDFFAVCMLGIFCNILDNQCGPDLAPSNFLRDFHINDDANNISPEERHRCVRTRGLAYDLIFWFFGTHEVTESSTKKLMGYQTWFQPHLARTSVAMIRYVEGYQQHHISNIIKNEFRHQVGLCFDSDDDISALVEEFDRNGDQHNTLAYTGPRDLTIVRRSKSVYNCPDPYSLLCTGYTAGDLAFLGIPQEQTPDYSVESGGSEAENDAVDSESQDLHESELEQDPNASGNESSMETDGSRRQRRRKRSSSNDSSDSHETQSDACHASGEQSRPPNKKKRA